MNKIIKIIFPIVILLIFIILDKNKQAGSIYIDIVEAKNTSISEDKPLLIIFDDNYDSASYIKHTEEYIICFLDYKSNEKIFEEYNIKKLPSYIIIDNRTNVIYKEEGCKNKFKLYEWLSSVKHKIRAIQKK